MERDKSKIKSFIQSQSKSNPQVLSGVGSRRRLKPFVNFPAIQLQEQHRWNCLIARALLSNLPLKAQKVQRSCLRQAQKRFKKVLKSSASPDQSKSQENQ